MSIFLKPVQRFNPSDPDAGKKWYPVQVTTKLVDETEVATLIAEGTTLNPMEALMAIRRLRYVVQRMLLDGKSVRLGDWGSFNITLSSKGVEGKSELTARNIKSVNINFLPGAELREAMQDADFIWLNKVLEGDVPSSSDNEEEQDPSM